MLGKKKLMASLIPVGLVAMLAAVAMAIVPAGASAAECRVLTSGTKVPAAGTCNEPPGVKPPQNLRDDFSATEPATTELKELEEKEAAKRKVEGGFGTSALAVNTAGPLKFTATVGGLKVTNENPAGYAYFGLKLDRNEVESTTVCRKALGWVTFVDIQNAKPSGVFTGEAPYKPGEGRGGLGPWQIEVEEDQSVCPHPGRVTVTSASLYFETFNLGKGVTATGTFVGKYENPGAVCPAGGVTLEKAQPGVTLSVGEKPETEGSICFVSANNYLFPEVAPKWEKFTNSNKEAGQGIWKS